MKPRFIMVSALAVAATTAVSCGKILKDGPEGGGGNGAGGPQGAAGNTNTTSAMGGNPSNGGGGNSAGGGGGGAGQGGSGAEAGAGGAGACDPITDDATHIGDECANGTGCPAGYTCHPHAGVLLQELCAVLCAQSCECPGGTACQEQSDKNGTWLECG